MKKNNKNLIISIVVCLLPIILGIVLYNKLPDKMPIHFNISDQPNNYAPKNFALFGIPIIMSIVQLVIILKAKDVQNEKIKFVKILEWIVPVLTVLLYIIMLEVSLGTTVYVGKSMCLILGILFIVLGNYIPKMNYEFGRKMFHPEPKSEKTFRKMSRLMGYSFFGIGIALLIVIIFI